MPSEKKAAEAEKGGKKAAPIQAGGAITISREAFVMLVIALILLAVMVVLLVFFPGSGPASQRAVDAVEGREAIVPNMTVSLGTLPPRGNASAPIAMIEFGDYQCAYCTMFYDGVEQEITRDYVNTGKVRYYFRDVPISSHDKAALAALAARCANAQGKFWEMHDMLYEKRDEWAVVLAPSVGARFSQYANETGLDGAEFLSCYQNSTYAADVEADRLGAQALGITATPKFAVLIPKSLAPDFESSFDAIKESTPPQLYTSIRLAQDDSNYVVVLEGLQPYETYQMIFGSVE